MHQYKKITIWTVIVKEKITDRKFSFILHDRLLLVAIVVHHILRIVEQSTFLWIETDFRQY